MNLSDTINLIRKKNQKGLSDLYDQYCGALNGIILRIVKNEKVAEEILQNTFLKIWDNIDSFDDSKGTFYTWMARIARNNALDVVRLKTFVAHEKSKEIDDVVYNNVSETKTSHIDVKMVLSGVEEKYSLVLEHVYLLGYNHRETAEILDLPLGTVKTRLRSALVQLRDQLKDEKSFFISGLLLVIWLMIWFWI